MASNAASILLLGALAAGVGLGCSALPSATLTATALVHGPQTEQAAASPGTEAITPTPEKVGTDLEGYYGDSYAVVIGIDAYQSMPPLRYAGNDAKRVKASLEARGFKVMLLLDAQATKSNIERALYKVLPDKLRENDRVLVYFAGHGVSRHGMGYLLPVEASEADASFAGIKMTEIQEAFANPKMYPAKHVLYIADACYSGLALSTRGVGTDRKSDNYLNHIVRHKVRVALTGGNDKEQVMEKNGHGLFTSQFLEALDGAADLDHDGIITSAELWPFLSREVALASRNRQTPQYGRSGTGEFIFRNMHLREAPIAQNTFRATDATSVSAFDSGTLVPAALLTTGALALVAGGVFHALWLTRAQEAQDATFVDQAAFENARDEAYTGRLGAVVGYSAAVILLSAGWWLTGGDSTDPFSATMSGDGVTLSWRF